MKISFVLVIIMSVLFNVSAQNMQHLSFSSFKELKVGDSLPDIPLGSVTNNYTKKNRFSDFKGKLIILDFWNTRCSACMSSFPHMGELQKKFSDQIQIFLVNTSETQEEINKQLQKPFKNGYKLPNLPSIVDAKLLNKLFPHFADPYHVWIDGKGIVRLTGDPVNTWNEKKIRDVLAGKEIKYLKYVVKTDQRNPYYSVVSAKAPELVQYSSFFTRFTDTLASIFGEQVTNKKDSVSKTVRNSYLNKGVLDLYRETIPDVAYEKWKNIIYNGTGQDWYNALKGRVSLLVKDTIKYFLNMERTPMFRRNDDLMRLYQFCYEQILPDTISQHTRQQYMLKDLNSYFGLLYGTEGKMVYKKLDFYALIRTSNEDKLHSPSNGLEESDFSWLIAPVFYKVLPPYDNTVLINETGMSDHQMYISLSQDITTLEALRRALQVYDLDIIKVERDWPILEIKEKDYKGQR